MNENKEMNGKYEIISRVTTGTGFNTVLGVNNNAMNGYEYVTWTENSRGFDNGHYFGDLQSARMDMLLRASNEFNIDLEHEFYEKFILEDIEANLRQLVNKNDVKELMNTKEFISLAYHKYMKHDNIDDTFLDTLESIIPSRFLENKESDDISYDLEDDFELER